MPATQTKLEIDAEPFTKREKWLVERLQEYRDLDLEIEGCQVAMESDIEPPSTTIRPPDDDDPYILAKYNEPLYKQERIEIAATIEKYIQPKWQYVSVERVNRELAKIYSTDRDEDYRIRDAVDATKVEQEPRVELTQTERAVIRHEKMIAEAKMKMKGLQHQKRVIDTALRQMSQYYPQWHDLLWRRYVEDEKFVVYLMRTGMSEKLYRNERHRALKKFDKLAVGLR